MTLVLKNCCFCVDLRTGSLTIGYLNLIGLIWLFVVAVFNLIYLIDNVAVVVLIAIDLVITVIHFILTLLLLSCIHRNIQKHIPTFLIYNAVLLGFHVVQCIISWFTVLTETMEIITNICSILLTIYFLLVIRSYWFRLKSENSTSGGNSATGQVHYPISMVYPAPGAYPVPGAYPGPGPHLAPGAFPAPGACQAPVAFPAPGPFPAPGAYPGPGPYAAPRAFLTPAGYPVPVAYPDAKAFSVPESTQTPVVDKEPTSKS